MKKLISKIISTLIATYSLLLSKLVLAASLSDGGSIISPPVGKGILPGSGSEGETIKSSVVFTKLLPFAINYAINIAIAGSVIMLIIGGYQFLTAYGNTEKKDAANRTITYSIIGLIVALTAYGIVAVITSIRLT